MDAQNDELAEMLVDALDAKAPTAAAAQRFAVNLERVARGSVQNSGSAAHHSVALAAAAADAAANTANALRSH